MNDEILQTITKLLKKSILQNSYPNNSSLKILHNLINSFPVKRLNRNCKVTQHFQEFQVYHLDRAWAFDSLSFCRLCVTRPVLLATSSEEYSSPTTLCE